MTQIQDADIEYYLYRIICGYYFIEIKDIKYKVLYPSVELKYKAELLYREILDQQKFDNNWLSDLQLQILLDTNNIWTKKDDQDLAQQKLSLELEKIDLYKEFTNANSKKNHKKNIQKINNYLSTLYYRKDSMNYLTLKHFANNIKHEFIILNSLLDENDNRVIPDMKCFNENYNNTFSQMVSKEILDNQIPINKLKIIARSDIWRSYYNDANAFPKSSVEANDDYRHLVSLTKMYDQIRQHPECPTDAVIEDDDALDGWFLYQKQKSCKEKQKNQILDKVGGNKIKNSGEVFVVTQDRNEARTIFGMNDEKTMRDIQTSVKLAHEKGSVSWTSLDHVIEDKLKEQGKLGYKEINK
jgi:hypothetical protein